MANEKEVVLHTKLRYKPETSDKYITIYFESATSDIIVNTNIDGISDGSTKLSDALLAIAELVASKALAPIYDTSVSLKRKDLVLARGQFGIESDTLQIKIGDGKTPWTFLKYAVTNQDGTDYSRIETNDASKIVTNESGVEINVPLTTLRASDTPIHGVRAFVQVIRDSAPIEETP